MEESKIKYKGKFVDNIYDIAFINYFILKDEISPERLLTYSIGRILDSNLGESAKIKLLGEEAYLDSKLYNYDFKSGNFEEFYDEVDAVEDDLNGKKVNPKLKLKLLKEKKDKSLVNLLIAEKLRKDYFPTSGLEGTFMAHGKSEALKNLN